MSDNIDIGIEASGDDGVNRLTSAIDRLDASITELGANSSLGNLNRQMETLQGAMSSSLGALTSQIQEMKQVMATGFADISATNQKLIESMGARQVRAIEETGTKSAAAWEAAGLKIKAADARTWEQIQRGSAANVTGAFAQMAEGIPVEAVLARYGELATGVAFAMDGSLAALQHYQGEMVAVTERGADRQLKVDQAFSSAQQAIQAQRTEARTLDFDRETKIESEWLAMLESATEKKLSLESAFARAQAEVAQQREAARVLDFDRETRIEAEWVAMLEAATEKKLVLEALFNREQAELAQQRIAAQILDYDREEKLAAQWQASLDAIREKTLADEALFNRTQAEIEQQRVAAQILDYDREEKLAAQWGASLNAAREKELADEALFNRTQADLAQQRIAAQILDYDREEKLAADWIRSLVAIREKELADEALFNRTQAELAAKRVESNALKNASYTSASPVNQIQTQIRAAGLQGEGLDASGYVGSKAAADAEGKSVAALRAELAALSVSSAQAGAAQLEMSGVLRQAEGAFRGAAHQAGIYGLHHGQLIALLAGGAVAAALHHIAETGAEVEFQLASLSAFSGDMTPVDMNKFVGVAAGTMTNLKDAAEGVHALAAAGMTQQQVLRELPDVMRLAALGEMSVAQAAEMAVESMHAFHDSGKSIGEIGDILTAVGTKSNVSIHTLAEDMKSAATTGELFGLRMEEITATVGVLAERGLTIQPLSSALNKLYEPSVKTAKAMAQLGLSTKDSAGDLKQYSDFMGELAAKVNQFQVPADVLKQLGMSAQSIKAMQVMTQHLDQYKELLDAADHAQDRMFQAAAAKANTTTGAYLILGSTVQGAMVNAFTEAEPIIRQVEEDLLGIARSQDTQDFLTGLATGFARLTHDIIENRGTIGTLIAAYAGLRLAVPALEAMAVASTFLFGSVTAVTVAAETQAVAVAADTMQLTLFTASETAAAVGATELAGAAAVSTTVLEGLAVAARVGLSVLGPMALVIAGVATAFDLFHGKMSDSEADHARMNTSIDSTIGSMDKEIERLQKLQEELEKTGRTGAESAYQVQLAFAQVEDSKAKAALDAARIGATAARAGVQGDDGTLGMFESNEAASALADTEKAYEQIHTRLTKLQEDKEKLASLQSADRASKDIHKLDERLERLPDAFKGLEAANPKAAAGLHAQVEEMEHLTVTTANYAEVLAKTDQLEKAISGSKLRVTPEVKPDKSGYKADISEMQERLTLAKMLADIRMKDAVSENKRGELGDLALINEQLKTRLELDTQAYQLAEKERNIAIAGGAKKSEVQKYQNKMTTAEAQAYADGQTADRAREDLWDRMGTAELQHRAKTLESKGQLEDAYSLQWEAKYGDALARLDDDLLKADSIADIQRLTKYKAFLKDLEEEGRRSAVFKMDVHQFDLDVEHMATKLAELRGRVGPGTGLTTQVSNALAQKDVLEQSIPQQQADYEKAKADAGTDTAALKQVDSMLKKIQSETAELNNIFIGLGQTIAQSLTNAFGAGGTALGGLITAATAYDAEMKTIKATTEAGSAEAISASSAAQVKAYGSMAGAAKGFFGENTKGYKELHAVEQAFRIYELGVAVSNAVKKMALEGSVTAATVVNTEARTMAVVAGEEGAAAAAVTGAEVQVAANQMEGQSAAVTAVADQGKGDPYSAWGRMAAMAAVMAGLGFAVSGGSGSSTTAADRQAAQGTGTVLGSGSAKSESIAKAVEMSAANSSTQINYLSAMAASLQAIQSNITSFASSVLRSTDIAHPNVGNLNTDNGGANTVLGLGLPVLGTLLQKIPAVRKLVTSVFGGKESLDDSGLSVDAASLGQIASRGVNAKTYADVTTSGGWFRSDKHNTKTTDVGAEADRQFSQILLSLGESVRQASTLLGAGGDAFTRQLDGFVVNIGKISLKGLSADDIQKQLEAVFSKVGDQMAQAAIPSLQQFQQVGEGYLQTLVRVAADYANVDASLQSISMTFGSVGVESIAARENLISLSGGIEKFQSSTADFATNFLTKSQQQAPVLSFVNQQLAAMNLGWVQTREQFAGVVLGLNLTTEAGQQTYSSLMGLESAFAATHAAIVDTSKTMQEVADERKDLQDELDQATMTSVQLLQKQRDALDESNRALFDQVQAAKAFSQVLSDSDTGMAAADAAYSVLQNVTKRTTDSLNDRIKVEQALHDAVESTLSSMADTVTAATTLADRQAARDALSAAADQADAGHMPTADSLKGVLATLKKDDSTKFASYADYLKDQYETTNSLKRLSKSSGDALTADQAQLKSLNDMLAQQKEQVDQLKGISTTALSIVDAIRALNLAVAAARQNPVTAATSTINDAYGTYLNRAPDAEGMKYWQKAVATGTPIDTVVNDIKTSTEATLDNLYQSVLGRAPDAEGLAYWMKAFGAKMDANEIEDWKKGASPELSAISSGSENDFLKSRGVPGFASGGFHAGGMRVVGENGPELEMTGPSRIFDAAQTAQMMTNSFSGGNNDALLAELKALRQEVAMLREYNSAENVAQVKQLQAQVDLFERVIFGGDAIQTKASA